MRKPLFTDRQQIIKELASLLKKGISFNFYQQSYPVQRVLVRGVDLKHAPPLVVLIKQNGFVAEESKCCLLYLPAGRAPCGFNSSIVKQSAHHLGVLLPTEIFKIQRRKYDRYSAPASSKAVFALKGGQRLYTGHVTNISLKGARLVGVFPSKLEKKMMIGPVSFTLNLQFAKAEITSFTVGEAVIAWLRREKKETKEIGLQLHMAPAEEEKLAHYIKMRSLEVEAAKSTHHTAKKTAF